MFALSTTLSGLVNLAVSYVPLVLLMLLVDVPLRSSILFLPAAWIILAAFTLGLSLVLSTIAVYFVDVREMYGVLLTAVMYLTPIIYPLEIVPERWQAVIRANPMHYMVELVRMPMVDGIVPPLSLIGIGAAMALASLLIGWVTFRRLSRGLYPYL